MALLAETLPAGAGWRIIREGFRLFCRNPGLMNFLCVSTWMMMLSAGLLPVVGQTAATVLVPVFLVSILNACRAIEAGQPVGIPVLFSGFEVELRTLVRIGFVYLLISTLVLAGNMLLVGDELPLIMPGAQAPKAIKPAELSALMQTLLITLNVSIILSLPALIAAPLAAWYRLPARKALFFALFGALANWRALGVMYLCLIALGLGVPLGLGMIARGMPEAVRAVIPMITTFGIVFVLLPTALAAFYIAVRSIFRQTADGV